MHSACRIRRLSSLLPRIPIASAQMADEIGPIGGAASSNRRDGTNANSPLRWLTRAAEILLGSGPATCTGRKSEPAREGPIRDRNGGNSSAPTLLEIDTSTEGPIDQAEEAACLEEEGARGSLEWRKVGAKPTNSEEIQ